jgi:hypothetical protein
LAVHFLIADADCEDDASDCTKSPFLPGTAIAMSHAGSGVCFNPVEKGVFDEPNFGVGSSDAVYRPGAFYYSPARFNRAPRVWASVEGADGQ